MRGAKSGVRMKKVLLVADNPTLQFILTRQIEPNPETKDTPHPCSYGSSANWISGAALKLGVIISLLSFLPFRSSKGKFGNLFLLQAEGSITACS